MRIVNIMVFLKLSQINTGYSVLKLIPQFNIQVCLCSTWVPSLFLWGLLELITIENIIPMTMAMNRRK
jgi:hypothetical protein